jgi:uncharacterized protein (DUF1697 family)
MTSLSSISLTEIKELRAIAQDLRTEYEEIDIEVKTLIQKGKVMMEDSEAIRQCLKATQERQGAEREGSVRSRHELKDIRKGMEDPQKKADELSTEMDDMLKRTDEL